MPFLIALQDWSYIVRSKDYQTYIDLASCCDSAEIKDNTLPFILLLRGKNLVHLTRYLWNKKNTLGQWSLCSDNTIYKNKEFMRNKRVLSWILGVWLAQWLVRSSVTERSPIHIQLEASQLPNFRNGFLALLGAGEGKAARNDDDHIKLCRVSALPPDSLGASLAWCVWSGYVYVHMCVCISCYYLTAATNTYSFRTAPWQHSVASITSDTEWIMMAYFLRLKSNPNKDLFVWMRWLIHHFLAEKERQFNHGRGKIRSSRL